MINQVIKSKINTVRWGERKGEKRIQKEGGERERKKERENLFRLDTTCFTGGFL